LSALVSDVERLRSKGETGIADDISELTGRMRRHIQRELARARLRHGRSQDRTPLRPVVDGILRALKRTPEGESLDLECTVEAALTVPVDADDLNELIGNLAENAVRYASSRILIAAKASPDAIMIRISDDGPGLDPDAGAEAISSEKRLDQSDLGAGLGLAISGDIVESFGGRLELGTAQLGGLEARIVIPLTSPDAPSGRTLPKNTKEHNR
jgi:signal transduction histidine kinase